MRLVTAQEMRELDRRTMEEFGTPGEVLMERAGQGVTDVLRRLIELNGFLQPRVHVLAGRGNNGGDAFVVARILHEMGVPVELWMAAAANALQGDALKHFSKMAGAGVVYRAMPGKEDWEEARMAPLPAEVLVDGLLGTGVQGPVRGPVADAILYVNDQAEDALVVSIDIPSGLHADTGEPQGDAVRADSTVTMGLPKLGLTVSMARDYVGVVDVVDIGIPPDFVGEVNVGDRAELIQADELRSFLPRRARESHKGTYGRVLVVGGARGYAGAVVLAARAAVRSGAGLVTALVPEGIGDVVSAGSMETMVNRGEETPLGSLAAIVWRFWRDRVDEFDAILVGPGMSRHQETMLFVRELLRDSLKPMVLDADALAVFAHQPDWIAKAKAPVVITPHPGELGLLFAQDVAMVQAHREGMAEAASKYIDATVVLKGAGTVVASPGRPNAVNLTGNPGMATGGSGDVLAGLVAGLIAQGLSPYDAARIAVYVHGRAGDHVAWRGSQAGLAASDLVEELPFAFRELSLR